MKKQKFVFLIASVFSLLTASSVVAEIRVIPNEYVIKPALAALGGTDSLDNKLRDKNLREVKDLGQGSHLVSSLTARATSGSIEDRSVAFNSNDTTCNELLASGTARYCSPNFVYTTQATTNDPSLSRLWGLGQGAGLNAFEAWDLHTGDDSVVIAVIDTGIDFNHPDLAGNMWVNQEEIPNNGIDDDNNGYIDDIHGISGSGGSPLDDNGHGSHVAGTIGARGNNSIGISGVTQRTKLMALKFLSANGSGVLSDAIRVINYMILMKNRGVNIRVSNNSWGGGGFSTPLEQAIRDASNAGIIFVAAAGNESNDNDNNPSYPAGYQVDNLVSVAAIDFETNLASFSNYGKSTVDIAAPGVGIYSTYRDGQYAQLNGTSMAAPHVSGALALLATYQPQLTNSELVQRMYNSGRNQPTLSNVVQTGRSIDVNRMLRNQVEPIVETPNPPLCPYSVQKIPYQPDTSADSTSIIQQADELNFTTAVLGFDFPFFGENISSLRISPNGVLYTKGAPSSLDYNNNSSAPLNSIAALHTDLQATQDPFGVRIANHSDRTTIYWRAHYYNSESLGDLEVRTTLYKSGVIESHVSIPNTRLLNTVREGATMGIKGANASLSNTYAYNNNKIEHLLGVRYTPQCGDGGELNPSLIINSFKAGKKEGKKLSKNVVAGSKIRLNVNATGSGTQLLHARFNKQSCQSTSSLNIQDGSNVFTTRIPTLAARYKNVLLTLGNKTSKLKIQRGNSNTRSRGRLLSDTRLARKCDNLYQRLQN